MAPQYDAITGGDTLRIPALQSPNYAAGVSGWIIKGDGTVEFNSGTFRGSITSGTSPGQHIVINNAVTGDAVDVYNSGNQLVYSINNLGVAQSYVAGTLDGSSMLNGTFAITKTGASSVVYNGLVIGNPNDATHDGILEIHSSDSLSGDSYILELHSAVSPGGLPGLRGNERNVSGSVVQTDKAGVNNLQHTVRTSFTTNGAGDGSFNPALGFTPDAAQATATGLTFTVPGTQILVWRDVLTSTNCAFRVFSPGGAAFVGTMTADFTFYG